jgi:hypothetical protein
MAAGETAEEATVEEATVEEDLAAWKVACGEEAAAAAMEGQTVACIDPQP